MKKLILTTTLFAALSLVLTGCPKKEEATDPSPAAHPVSTNPASAASPAAPAATPVDAAAVTAALKEADAALSSVTVAIDDKGIKLTGTVANNGLKKKAGEAATKIAGGKKVINQLLVK